jgi:hypothetical protein
MQNQELEAEIIALAAVNARPFVLYSELSASSSKAWLVRNMLGAGEMSAWYGPPGCGKGVIVEDMALHIAAGQEWHGRQVNGGAVVYIALERKKVVERRAIAFREKHGLQDLPFAVVGGVYDFRQAATADQIADICKQVTKATAQPVVLVVIDTVSRALAGGDENSPKDMGGLVMTSGLIQEKCPTAHVLWVHHIPHDTDRLRGHGALLGAVDTSVSVSSAGAVRTARVVKANDSEEGENIAFTIDSVTIHTDGTTAPVAIPADANTGGLAKIKRKLSDNAKLGLDALIETLLNHGRPPPPSLGISANVVTFEEWKQEMVSRSVLDQDNNNHGRDFWRIRNQLHAKAVIGIRDDHVWLISG